MTRAVRISRDKAPRLLLTKKPKAKRKYPEHALQKAVVQHLRLAIAPGVFWCSIPNAQSRNRERLWLWEEGLRTGSPDLFFLKDKRAHGLELKAPGNGQDEAQALVEQEWTAAGGVYRVATGLDEALAVLAEWGVARFSASTLRRIAA